VSRRLIVDPSIGAAIQTLVYIPNQLYSVTLLDAIPVTLDVLEVHYLTLAILDTTICCSW
jgi:hypothetical protein